MTTAIAWGGESPLLKKANSSAARHWADSVYKSLTERQRVAQLFCPKAIPTKGDESKAAIKRLVQTDGVGGLLFTEGTIDQYASLTNYAQSLARVPLLMTLDGEWGLAMRIRETPRFPSNMALGAMPFTQLIYDYGREVARECREIGINVNFAPVADVNSNPSNPVIGFRSFGEDPQRVALAVNAYSQGLEDGGVQAVAKHFPGHGDTDTDSHKALPTVNRTRSQLDKVELYPFRQFNSHGGSAIMTGHIAVPAIDPSGTPASLSPKAYELLRKDVGFKGLVYTDALGMKGAVAPKGMNNCVAALKAGADVLLASGNISGDIDAVMDAVAKGTISRKVIEERCKRVLAFKYALTQGVVPPVETAGLAARINSRGAADLNNTLAAASMTLLFNNGDALPLSTRPETRTAVVSLGGGSHTEFDDMCRKYAPVTTFRAPDGNISEATLRKLRSFDRVVVALYSDKEASRKSFARLRDIPGVVVVSMLNPYKTALFAPFPATMGALLMAYDNLPETRSAAAQAIYGGQAVAGTFPVNLEGVGTMGQGVKLEKSRLGYATPTAKGMAAWLNDSIDNVVNRLIAAGGMPGAQVLVAHGGDIVHNKSYGRLTAGGAPVDDNTIYDLASVSKTIGTLPGVMLAYDRGLIDLEAPVSQYIPGMRRPDKQDITVRQLLYHESGMQPSLNMFTTMIDTASYTAPLITSRPDRNHNIKIQRGAYGHRNGRLRRDITSATRTDRFPIEAARGVWVGQCTYDSIMGRIYASPLRKDNSYAYSCLNFCLLMDAEQRVTGKPHRDWVSQNIWGPLGAASFCYRPAENGKPTFNVAPTENDTYLRRQMLRGFVHDELAAFSGGIQGNAGLFGNATDLAKMCQMWLNGGVYGNERILSEETVRLFTTDKSPTCRRGLGFDKPDTVNPDYSPTCDEADASVYGHTGFTGTCFWVDPENDLIFIFLTNRVNPTRDSPVFNSSYIRSRLFRHVYQSLPNKEGR